MIFYFQRPVNWSQYATENVDSYPASTDMFQEIVYGDLYNFVPLTSDKNSAKVCTDEGRETKGYFRDILFLRTLNIGG